MSGPRDLADRLLQVTTESVCVEDGWRRVGPFEGDGFLACFSAEIDETVLPRRLAMRNQNGGILYLEAANRRLRRFAPPIPEHLRGYSACFQDGAVRADEPSLSGIREMLGQHFSGDDHFWLRAAPLSGGGLGGQTGVTATALTNAWLVCSDAPTGTGSTGAVERFRNGLADNCTGWAHLEDGRVEACSDTEFAAEMVEYWNMGALQDLSQGADTNAMPQGAPKCLVLGSAGDVVVLIVVGNTCFILRTQGMGIEEIGKLWRREGL